MSTLRLYFDLGGNSGRYLHQLCDKFEQQHGVEIQRTNLEIHALQEQLTRGHDLPEMALLPSDMISWADTLQLSAIPAQWQLPEISSLCLATLQHQSLQLGIPVLAGNHLLLFYDKRRDVPPRLPLCPAIRGSVAAPSSPPLAWSFPASVCRALTPRCYNVLPNGCWRRITRVAGSTRRDVIRPVAPTPRQRACRIGRP